MEFGNALEQLEKLNELKEKGILTQKEFDNKKQELLSCQISNIHINENKTSATNIVASLIITLFVLFVIIVLNFDGIPAIISIIISAIIYSIIAANLDTKKYDAWYCQHPFGVFMGTIVLWIVAFPIYTYAFLQIKNKNVLLKKDISTK